MEFSSPEFGDIKTKHALKHQCDPSKKLSSFLILQPWITLFGPMVLLTSLFYLKSVPPLHSHHFLFLDSLHSYIVREKINLFFLSLALTIGMLLHLGGTQDFCKGTWAWTVGILVFQMNSFPMVFSPTTPFSVAISHSRQKVLTSCPPYSLYTEFLWVYKFLRYLIKE